MTVPELVSSNMGATVHPLTRRQNGARRDRVANLLSKKLGVKPATAHSYLHGSRDGVQRKTVAIIEAHRELGESERLANFLSPIDAARRDETTVQLTQEVVLQAVHHDVGQDERLAAYLVKASDETAQALVHWLRKQRHHCDMLERALVTHHGLEA